jgi:hypothetical protein
VFSKLLGRVLCVYVIVNTKGSWMRLQRFAIALVHHRHLPIAAALAQWFSGVGKGGGNLSCRCDP